MQYGSPYAAGYGNPENHFLYAIPDSAEMALRGYESCPIKWKFPDTELGPAYVHIYRNTKKIASIYTPANTEKTFNVPAPFGSQSMSIQILRAGMLNDPSYECERVPRTYEAIENKRISLQWTFTPKIIEPEESEGAYTSNWILTGLIQGQNTGLIQGKPAQGRLTFEITIDAGSATVNLYSNTSLVASGTAVIAGAPFSVSLIEQNSSGINGSVTVSDTVIAMTGGVLDIRWPKEIKIKRDTVLIDTIKFTGQNVVRWTEAAELAADTYDYTLTPVSDTGIDGTESSVVSVTSVVAPVAPTGLAYISGNAGAGLTLGFYNSATALATYRLYMATAIGDTVNLNKIQATASSGVIAEANTIVTPAITGYAGMVYIIVRAVLGGVEERNLNMLEVELDASGNVVSKRPNIPSITQSSIVISSGRELSVRGVYDTMREKAVATELHLFTRTPTGSYSSAVATASLGASVRGLKAANVLYTFPSNGYYYIKLLAATSAGVLSQDADEVEIFVTDEVLPAATNITGVLSRG